MSTDTKSRKIRRLKGSVLFTTLVVMILILLIMLAAIGLAGAASKKAYSTWYDNQTKYTAQDLVDNVIDSLAPGQPNEALGGNIVSHLTSKGNKVTVDVEVNGSNNIPGYGRVAPITFEYVANNRKEFTISGLSGHDNERIIKVSASVTMGGETSTYSTYVVGNALSGRTDANGGGYIALSDLKGGSGSNDAPATVGRFYSGIDKQIDKTAAGNQTISAGDIFVNAKEYYFNADKNDPAGIILGRNDPENGYYGGMRVEGNLTSQNGIHIQSQYPPDNITDLTKEKFYNIPYLFVKGQIKFDQKGITVVDYNSKKTLVNVYCGSINIAQNAKLEGNMNLMCMDEGANNYLKLDSSSLTDWAANVTGVGDKGILESGNLYCKGNFTKEGNGMDVYGDLCVVGNLKVDGSLIVHGGDAYIGGTLTGTVTVDTGAGYKVVSGLGAGGNAETFVQKLKALNTTENPNAAATASRFETAFKLKGDGADGKNYVQTLENIKKQFKDDSSGTSKYRDVVETSKYTGTDKWDGLSPITKSCIWDSTVRIDSDGDGVVESNNGLSDWIEDTIFIQPPENEEVWINIKGDLTSINKKKIVVDDSKGRSVKFFIEKNGESQTLSLDTVKFVTQTYNDIFYGSESMPDLSSYPEAKYVPQIYMYASSDTNVSIEMRNQYVFTGDIIAPKAKFKGDANNGNNQTVNYTYYNYINPPELSNPVKVERSLMLALLGSLEVGEINVTNEFGYLYVDDPPFGGMPPGLSTGFSWTTIDGYSTY